jgi:hypothetical protein
MRIKGVISFIKEEVPPGVNAQSLSCFYIKWYTFQSVNLVHYSIVDNIY